MPQQLQTEIVKHIFENFGLLNSDTDLNKYPLLSNQFKNGLEIKYWSDDGISFTTYAQSAQLQCLDLKLNLMFWNLSDNLENYYVLLVSQFNLDIYILRLTVSQDLSYEGEIFISNKKGLKPANLYLQANLLAGIEKINNFHYIWKNILEDESQTLHQTTLNFLKTV